MKKGDKVRCITTFKITNQSESMLKFPQVHKNYTIRFVLSTPYGIGIMLEEIEDQINPYTGRPYAFAVEAFELIDGPHTPKTLDDKPHWVISKEVKEQRPFHMIP